MSSWFFYRYGLSRNVTDPHFLFTARAQERDIKLGEEVGANAYLTKPFDSKTLLEKISGLLESAGSKA